jgi:hypothetical protein
MHNKSELYKGREFPKIPNTHPSTTRDQQKVRDIFASVSEKGSSMNDVSVFGGVENFITLEI